MTSHCGGSLVKCFAFSFLLCQVFSAPKSLEDGISVKEIFSESKRDVSTPGMAAVPLLKSPFFNPLFMYPPFIPPKPFMYPFTPADLLLNRFVKSVAGTAAPGKSSTNISDPSLMSAYFKAKKDEFLAKLYEKLMTVTPAPGAEISARSVPVPGEPTPDPAKPMIDSSFFLKKKFEFLDTLFKALNVTPTPLTDNSTDTKNETTTSPSTPKPTIVPPDFWFPFAKLPKPTKAPKPTKPPKAKKILKDALDTILLQSLLIDMGVDPKDASLNKRAALLAKKPKKEKVKPEDDSKDISTPAEVDPDAFMTKASDCLNKLYKLLNGTKVDKVETYAKPKTTPTPVSIWKSDDEDYTTKLDSFLDLLIKSLDEAKDPSAKMEKFKKPTKSKPGKKIVKRSTFLDELFHRATTTPATTTTTTTITPPDTTQALITIPAEYEKELVTFLEDCCCCSGKCLEGVLEKPGKSSRSLIFKPFGSGYWIPQYLYASKMGLYLDKLMDTINTAAASEVESESSSVLKRSADPSDIDPTGLPGKEAAIDLIIAELTDLKNNLVDAFADGIKAQKDATPTQKPFGPGAKSFKKPFWGPKMFPTTDPIAPIQKRIDILNDIFDKLTKVEKTLIFTAEPEYDPKLLANLTEILQLSKSQPKFTKTKLNSKTTGATSEDPNSPEYFLAKTREFLKNLSGSKVEDSDDK